MTDISLATFREYLLGVKSPATAVRYTEYAGKFLQVMKASGYEKFLDLPPDMLQTFASQLSRQGNQPNTVKVYTFAAKKYLEWVARKGVAVTPQHRPELPKVVVKKRDVLPADQFTRYFRQADIELEDPIRTAVMLLPCCGLRGSEMVALKLDQIHHAEVPMKKGKKKKTLFLRFVGKGGKERNVPLMEEGVEILMGYLLGWRKKHRGIWLFPSIIGYDREGLHHISGRGLRHGVQTLCQGLGLDFSAHTMRRTYITTLWRRGVDLATIASIAGHASIQTTLVHYIAMEPQDTLKAFHEAGGALTED